MGVIKVNTDAVISCASKIRGYNNDIRNRFSDLQSKMSALDTCWDGSAATNAMQKFNSIKSSFCDARYAVVDDYVNFLMQQIGEGYVQTEEVNTSLADQFK